MKTLLLDTSHRKSFIALAQDKKILVARLMQGGVRQSECAGALLATLLQEVGWGAAQLARIGVGVGPGSYTGIRVGISLAKGINLATSVPLVPFCSLTAYRPAQRSSFATLFDARAGGVYFLQGQRTDQVCFEAPRALSDQEVLPFLAQVDLILSPDLEALKERLPTTTPWENPDPDFQGILETVLLSQGFPEGDIDALYLKRPEPQRRLEENL